MQSLPKSVLREAVRSTVVELVLKDRGVEERYDVFLKPNFSTACWSFLPPHKIYVGDRIFENARAELTELERQHYVSALFRHELGHLLFTERDFVKVRSMLARAKAPFSLWNLMEDARIEGLLRQRLRAPLGWLTFEHPGQTEEGGSTNVCPVNVTPEELLFRLIQAETDTLSHPAIGAFLSRCSEATQLDAIRVQAFYRRMLFASSALDLEPVLVDWVKQFPQSKDSRARGASQDLALSELIKNDSEFRGLFEQDLEDITIDEFSHSAAEISPRRIFESVLLNSEGLAVNRARADRLAKVMLRLFEDQGRTKASIIASKHLNLKGMSLGSDRLYKTASRGRRRRKVGLVLDCSGSMKGVPLAEAKVLIQALNRLVQQGIIECTVFLSAVIREDAIWHRIALPVEEAIVAAIHAPGAAEGLRATILANQVELRQCDEVFVYSDGEIGDAPIDKSELHKHGIFTTGLYCGDCVKPTSKMLTFFDRCIARENVEDLLDALLKLVGTRR